MNNYGLLPDETFDTHEGGGIQVILQDGFSAGYPNKYQDRKVFLRLVDFATKEFKGGVAFSVENARIFLEKFKERIELVEQMENCI